MVKLIMAAFANHTNADEAITELEQAEVPGSDFSLFAKESNPVPTSVNFAEDLDAAGGLSGLTLGAITTTGMLVAGPAALLTGLGWIALTNAAGGLLGALVGLGIPEHTADKQALIVGAGGVLLGIEDTELSESEIYNCFESHNARHIVVIEHNKIDACLIVAET